MKNYRPLSREHSAKSTNNHRFVPSINPSDKLAIKQINISDRDKFNTVVYIGSSGGKRYDDSKKSAPFMHQLVSIKAYNYTTTSYHWRGYRRIKLKAKKYGTIWIQHSFKSRQIIGKLICIDSYWFRITS